MSRGISRTRLIFLDPEEPFTVPELEGKSDPDGTNYTAVKLLGSALRYLLIARFSGSYQLLSLIPVINKLELKNQTF